VESILEGAKLLLQRTFGLLTEVHLFEILETMQACAGELKPVVWRNLQYAMRLARTS
jgi:hypothetical protein